MHNTAGTFSSTNDEPPQDASPWRSDYLNLHQRRESAETLVNDEAQHSVNEVDMDNSESAARILPLEALNTAKLVPINPVADEVDDASTNQKSEDAVQPLGPETRGDDQPDANPHEPYDGESRDTDDADGVHFLAPTDRTLWTPPWLRKSSLVAFFGLFTALWAVLIVLWRYDVANSGFVIYPKATPFSWTYSPTAVLVLITGLWRQVDYHAKINQPWQLMAKGPTPAAHSVLLDYISPSMPMGLLKAFRNRHWTVAATTTGFAILKLITVTSTALLMPVATQVTGMIPVQINSTFDSSAFWNSTSSIFGTPNTPSNTSNEHNHLEEIFPFFTNISSSPAVRYSQFLQGQIPYPIGTQEAIAFQDAFIIQPSDIRQIDSFSVTVNTFVPEVNCEELNYAISENEAGKVQVKIPLCGAPEIWLSHCDEYSEGCFPYITTFNMYRVYCSNSTTSRTHQTEVFLLLVASEIRRNSWPGFIWRANSTVSKITAIACKAAYQMGKSYRTSNLDQIETSPRLTPLPYSGEPIANFTDRRLTEILYSVLVAADTDLDGPLRAVDGESGEVTWGNETSGSLALFGLMSHSLHRNKIDYTEFFDGKLMIESATTVLTQLAVFFTQETLVIADNITVSATSVYSQDRLRFREFSVLITVSGLFVLSILALSVFFTFYPVVSQDPSLIGSNATILARSPSLSSLLEAFGGSRTSQISHALETYMFTTAVVTTSTFHLRISETSTADINLCETPISKRKHWIPVPARAHMAVLTFTLPFLILILTEVLYQKAEKTDGLAVSDIIITFYSAQYVSALVALIVSSLFNSLDFAIVTFSTFSVMRSRAISPHEGFTNSVLGNMTPLALFHALRNGRFGLLSSNISAIIGSILTIIVSNLWIQRTAITTFDIKEPVTTIWNLDWVNSAVDDGGASAVLNAMQKNSTSLPDSAFWNDLVFPSFSLIARSDQESEDNRSMEGQTLDFSMKVPSIRPKLFCQIATERRWSISTTGGKLNRTVQTSIVLPSECILGDENNDGNVSFGIRSQNPSIWSGLLLDLYIGGEVEKECPPCTTYSTPSYRPDNPMGCPSIGVWFGRYGRESDTYVENYTALVCTQKIQKVQVHLNLNSTISSSGEVNLRRSKLTSVPAPIESTAVNLTSGDTGLEAFNYHIQPHFDNNITSPMPDDTADPFFRYLISGSSGYRMSELAGNTDLLITAVSKLYSDFMVQVIDSTIFRRPAEQPQKDSVNGTATMKTTRLFMNRTAKVILQTFLGSMIVFGLTAFFLVDLKGTLPRSPHSIASIMALFAGSDFCNNHIPEGAEWMNKQQLDRLFEGYLFSLGWWKHRVDQTGNQDSDDQGSSPTFEERFGIDIGTPERRGFGTKRLKDSD